MLTDSQISIIRDLFEKDPEVKKFLLDKIQTKLNEAQKTVKTLETVHSLFACGLRRRGSGSIAGSKNHRAVILETLAANPKGMSISQLREALAAKNHNINDRVLSTIMSSMRQEWTESNGNKGIRVKGNRPNTLYFAK